MSKKEINEILKQYNYRMIAPSWFLGDESEKSVLFRAYDKKTGTCFEFYVDWGGTEHNPKPFAWRTMLSNIMLHEFDDVTHMFFKKEERYVSAV